MVDILRIAGIPVQALLKVMPKLQFNETSWLQCVDANDFPENTFWITIPEISTVRMNLMLYIMHVCLF